MTGYAIVYNNRQSIDPLIGHSSEDAEALLRVFKIKWPTLAEDAEIVSFDFPAKSSFAFHGEESMVKQ